MAVAIIARHRSRFAAIQRSDRAVGDVKNRGMHERRVIAVALVLEDEFPVGLDAMFQETRGDLDLALGRVANQPVDGLFGAAKMLLKRRAFGGERAKHKTTIGLHARDAAKPELCLVCSFVSVRKCVTAQTTVI